MTRHLIKICYDWQKREKGTWTVGYCCFCVSGLRTIKPWLKNDGEVGLAPAFKIWNFMPGHHFQFGRGKEHLLNPILILEDFL